MQEKEIKNAFQMVRPVSKAGPSAPPAKVVAGQPPLRLSGSLVLDGAGRLRPPDTHAHFGYFIESREQYQAGLDKRRALAKTSL